MRFWIILIFVIVLISNISFALEPGKLWINDVFIPSGLEKIELEKKAVEPKQISYVYANGQRIAKIENNEVFYFHNDHLGSPRVITNSAGEVVEKIDYLPFGESFEKNEKISYNSKELDKDTKLNYYGARYYNAPVGRFITADTVKGVLIDPQSLNLYVYVKNNPMKYVDPTGNQEREKKKALALRANPNYDYDLSLMVFDDVVQQFRNADYEVVVDTVSTSEEFISAILNFPGQIDLFYEAAHGNQKEIVLSKEKRRFRPDKLIKLSSDDFRNLDLSNKFSSDARSILYSCSVADTTGSEDCFAETFSKSTGTQVAGLNRRSTFQIIGDQIKSDKEYGGEGYLEGAENIFFYQDSFIAIKNEKHMKKLIKEYGSSSPYSIHHYLLVPPSKSQVTIINPK